jgi:ABC-type glycerol-3-phosphate transport system substrate-binding protein
VQGTVSIWHAWPEDQVPALVQIIADFQFLYPNVLFDVTYMPVEELRRYYELQTIDGNGPGLLFGPADWGPSLYEANLIRDFGEIANEDLLNTLNPPGLRAGRYQDTLISLPYAVYGVVLYRNKDIMTIRADTFDELLTLAQAATQGQVFGAILERSFLYSGGHLAGLGGQWMDENGLPTFDSEEGRQWLELLDALEQAGPPSFLGDEDLQAFKDGRVGWIIDGTWNLAQLIQAVGPAKLAIDPWPAYGEHNLAGFVWAESIYLSPEAEGIQLVATQKFVEYFLSPAAQSKLAQVGRIPAVSGVTLSNAMNGPLIAEAMQALAGGTTYPLRPEVNIYNAQIDSFLRLYFEQEQPNPDSTIQQAFNAILNAVSSLQMTATPVP